MFLTYLDEKVKSTQIISGIYAIINVINNKHYIGSSIDMYSRTARHKADLNGNRHKNPHLQAAWNKYREENFICVVLEKCPKKDLTIREQWYMDFLDTVKNGYNIQDTSFRGANNLGRKASPETKEKMRLAHLGKPHPSKPQSKEDRKKQGESLKKHRAIHKWGVSEQQKQNISSTVKQLWVDGVYKNRKTFYHGSKLCL